MSVISFTTAVAGRAGNRTGALAQALLGAVAACAAAGLLAGSATCVVVIPGLMRLSPAVNRPGARMSAPVEYALGQPGARRSP